MEACYSSDIVKETLAKCNSKTTGFFCLKFCPYSKYEDCIATLHKDASCYIAVEQEQEK